MNKETFFKISYGLYVVTTKSEQINNGCIVNSFFQITDNPLQVCLVLNKKNYTTKLIKESKVFNAGILAKDNSMNIIKNFGFHSGRDIDKFKDVKVFKDIHSIKQVKDVVAYFSCTVMNEIDVGTHYIFIAGVDEAEVLNEKDVLTYSEYHKQKSKKGYRCTVCGFIYEGDVLPDDYICPICKVDTSYFEKL